MAEINVEKLLQPISADAPCGANLEYDPAYTKLMNDAQGTPEREMGTTKIPAQEPNWREVKESCLELLQKSLDLTLAGLLCEAAMCVDGLPGFRSGLAVISGLISGSWDLVYPRLDPDDGNDPTMRLNLLAGLCDPVHFLLRIRNVPLTNSPKAGRFSLRMIGWATGRTPPPPDVQAPKPDLIEAAFKDTPEAELKALFEIAGGAMALVKEIDAALNARLGVGRGVNFEALLRTLQEVVAELAKHLPEDRAALATAGDGAASDVTASSARGRSVPGEIGTPGDVISAIERICEYYERSEPSSPVPLILRRAQRLVGKGFLDIVKDLTPEAVAQMLALGGIQETA